MRKGKESAERFEIKKKIERERRDRMGLSKKIFFVFVFFFLILPQKYFSEEASINTRLSNLSKYDTLASQTVHFSICNYRVNHSAL